MPDEPRHFRPSPHWGTPAFVPPLPGVDPAPPERYEEVLAGLSRFSGEVEQLFRKHRPGNDNMAGFDSLYIGPSGTFHLLHPHTHLRIAGEVLRTIHPGVPPPDGWRADAKGGGWHHRHLTLLSGIQRMQIYRDGVGATVQMGYPPTITQLEALRSAYTMTPMRRFAAEIDGGERTLVTLGSFAELADLVEHWDPADPAEMLRLDPRLAGLYGG